MHTRSIRAALLTSLGLIPLGCGGDTRDTTRVLPGPTSAPSEQESAVPSEPAVPADPNPGRPPSPACGESTPATSEVIDPGVGLRSPVLTPGIATGIYRCDSGLLHRPAPVTCHSGLPRSLPPAPDAGVTNADAGVRPSDAGPAGLSQLEYLYAGVGYDSYGAACRADSDCTKQPLGYCAPVYYGGPAGYGVACQYGCLRDDDCGAGALCECGDPVGHCVTASCRSDADCGDGLKCGAWFTAITCTSFEHYSCQLPEDECVTGLDCGPRGVCSGESGARRCDRRDSGACGRPFLVAGEPRVAALRAQQDWAGAARLMTSLGALSREQRALAGEHWARAALLEHASIAAFARFTLQLLELGAPRELLELSQQAMLDETAHAKACFELASRYLPAPVGPGPLPLGGALEANDLKRIVVLVFQEGCVGETVATLEAHEALDHARDPEVQAVLKRVAQDELQHAELAWRFVRWALGQDPEIRRSLEAEVARLERELQSPQAVAGSGELPEHGVLSARRLANVRRAALAEVVLPCALSLLGPAAVERALSAA